MSNYQCVCWFGILEDEEHKNKINVWYINYLSSSKQKKTVSFNFWLFWERKSSDQCFIFNLTFIIFIYFPDVRNWDKNHSFWRKILYFFIFQIFSVWFINHYLNLQSNFIQYDHGLQEIKNYLLINELFLTRHQYSK